MRPWIEAGLRVVTLARAASGEVGTELVLTAPGRKVVESLLGDWVGVGARNVSETGRKLRPMSMPVVPDGTRQSIELLDALVVANELALSTGRAKLAEAESGHNDDDRGAD